MSKAKTHPEELPPLPAGDGPPPLEIVRHDSAPMESMMKLAIEKGATVDTLERLMAMAEKLRAAKAKEVFDRAMAAFQAECPEIAKTKEVHTRDGKLAYCYAPIESIIAQVKPILQRHGFSYATQMELREKTVRVICRVKHEGGHSEESPMEVPLGNKTPIMSDTQVVAAAATYAKRYAFLNAFGIMTGDEDNDARPMTQDDKPLRDGMTAVQPAKTPPPAPAKPAAPQPKTGDVRQVTAKVEAVGEVEFAGGVKGWELVTDKGIYKLAGKDEAAQMKAKQLAATAETFRGLSAVITETFGKQSWIVTSIAEPDDIPFN